MTTPANFHLSSFGALALVTMAGCLSGTVQTATSSEPLVVSDDAGDDADAAGDDAAGDANSCPPPPSCPTWTAPDVSDSCAIDAGDDADDADLDIDDASAIQTQAIHLSLRAASVQDFSDYLPGWLTSFFCSQPQTTAQSVFNDLAGCGLSIAGGASKVAGALSKIRSCYSAQCNQTPGSVAKCLASISGVTIDGVKASTLVGCVGGVMNTAVNLLGAAYQECERQAQPPTDGTTAGNNCAASCPAACDRCCDNMSSNCTSGRDNAFYNACRTACYQTNGWTP